MGFLYNISIGIIVIYFIGRVIISVFKELFLGFRDMTGINKSGLNEFVKLVK